MHRFLSIAGAIACSFVLCLTWNTVRADDTVIYLPVVAAGPSSVEAAARPQVGLGAPWRDHAAPWTFSFGNRMDQHQQSKTNGTNRLTGFLYIDFTGEMTKKGVPIAVHTDCNVSQECTVGWTMHGILTEAVLVSAGQGRPQWCIPAGEWPTDDPRYTHFHWVKDGQGLGEATPGDRFEGYLIKLTAVDRFAFGHAGNHGSGGSSGAGGGCDGGSHDDGSHDDGSHDDGSHDDGGCSGSHDDTGGPPDGTGSGGGCDDGSHDDGAHDDGGCSDGSHDDGGCSGGGHSGQPKHIPVEPGVDLITHVNVTVCE